MALALDRPLHEFGASKAATMRAAVLFILWAMADAMFKRDRFGGLDILGTGRGVELTLTAERA